MPLLGGVVFNLAALKVNHLFFPHSVLRSSNQENICELQQPQDLICLNVNGVCSLSVIEKGGDRERQTDRDRRASTGIPAPPAVPMHSRTVDSIQLSSRHDT